VRGRRWRSCSKLTGRSTTRDSRRRRTSTGEEATYYSDKPSSTVAPATATKHTSSRVKMERRRSRP
jgi:hypothetical protein